MDGRIKKSGLSGKEATTLRKVLLVLALIGASFAGGAVVNGPGLNWAKRLIAERLHRSDSIPTLDLDDGPAVAIDSSPVFPDPPAKDAPAEVVSATPEPATTPDPILGSRPQQNQGDSASKTEPPPLSPSTRPPVESTKSGEPPGEPSPLFDPPPLNTKERPKDMPKLATPPTGWEDAPGSAPSTAVLPGQKPVKSHTPAPDPAVTTATNSNLSEPPPLTGSLPTSPTPTSPGWSSLKTRMRALGVSKFWLEGSPNGVVTFRCLVPLDNTEAEGRQFEAEGDDEFQAADSALRRVAVWKAAERLNKR